MGVYHLMGLGVSVGAVTSPLSYLADRFARDDASDQAFFGGSGERSQGPEHKRGDVQGLVFFTTQEIINRKVAAQEYVLNERGSIRGQTRASTHNVRHELCDRLLPPILLDLTSVSRDPEQVEVRRSIELYWCQIDLNDPVLTFERVARVIDALKGVGSLGKEIWINLTSGSNIINTALNLAVSLRTESARMYYVLSPKIICAHHTVPKQVIGTDKDQFWVELPIIYADFNPGHDAVIEELATVPGGALSLGDLRSRISATLAGQGRTIIDDAAFLREYIKPLLAQQLIRYRGEQLEIGLGRQLLERYYAAARRSGSGVRPLADLAKDDTVDWLCRDDLVLRV